MDIALTDGLSFKIFEQEKINCPVIFTTAYDEYWQEAFEHNSIDYLLKPIKQEKLEAAIKKYDSLKKYFASYNKITDRTPEILGRMISLEEITFDSCGGLTTAGIAALAGLPRLRELRLSGMANVTAEAAAAFSEGVHVTYAP